MLVTFTALHEAKRDGTLAQTLAAMTPAERVEAAQVCAASSTRTVSEWLVTFGELVEAEAVYCEACGHEVDPAEAVLDGELMVCPGCAPCSTAEFEEMQMAEADRLMAAEMAAEMAALVPDPETWQAVSEVPCEPVAVEDNPITHPYLMTGSPCAPEHRCDLSRELSRRAIFDALCQAADELRDYWRDVPRRVEAINVAWEWVMLQPVYHFNSNGDLLVPSGSKAGVVYAVGHSCPCTAGRWGNHCRHSVIADIIGRAVRIARLKAA